MEWLIIYLFVMIESIKALFAGGWAIFWAGIVLAGLLYGPVLGIIASDNGINYSDLLKNRHASSAGKVLKWCVVLGFTFGCLSFLIPTQKDMAIIAGTGVTYKAVTSEAGQRIGGKAVSLLEQKIDAALSGDTVEEKPKK